VPKWHVGDLATVGYSPSRQGYGAWFVVERICDRTPYGAVFIPSSTHPCFAVNGLEYALDSADRVDPRDAPDDVLVELAKWRLSQ
jgi:hypothetical protein